MSTISQKEISKYFDLVASTLELTPLQKQVLRDIPFPSTKSEAKKKLKNNIANGKDHPKKLSGYLLFCNDFRDRLRDENGKLENAKQVMSDAAATWKNFGDEDKVKWNKISNEKFEEARSKFMKANPDWKPAAKPMKVKVPRATSPWMVFLKEHIKKSSLKGVECMKEASVKWETLSNEDKKPFIDVANESKKEVEKFKDFAKSVLSDQIVEGVANDSKSLREDAAKRWTKKCLEEESQ
jgi:hypothetical protein